MQWGNEDMNFRRRHLVLGLLGIYLLVLTGFLLYGGIFQFTNLTFHIFNMKMVGTDRIHYNIYVWLLYIIRFLVAINQIIAGCYGVGCILITPPMQRIKKMAYLLCVLEMLTILRDITWQFVDIATFTYIHRAIIVFLLAKYWGKYQQDLFDRKVDREREYFPFIRELYRYKAKIEP